MADCLRLSRTAVGLLFSCMLCACSSANSSTPESVTGCDRQLANADFLFPDRTLTDWASFADHVASIEVIDEAVVDSQDVYQRGEGYVARKVAVRVLETVWSNPHAEALDDDLEFFATGWVLKEVCPEMLPIYFAENPGPRLEIQGRYTLAFVRYTMVAQVWAPMAFSTGFPLNADPVAVEDVDTNGIGPVAAQLTGLSSEEIRAVLDGTSPYPEVEGILDLPAEERLAAAFAR
jgi:hypothetical protein